MQVDSSVHPVVKMHVKFRATGKLSDTETVVTEATLPVEFGERGVSAP